MADKLTTLEWWTMVLSYYSLERTEDGRFVLEGPHWEMYERLSDRFSIAQERRWRDDDTYPTMDSLDDDGHRKMRARAQNMIDRINAKARLHEGAMVATWLKR